MLTSELRENLWTVSLDGKLALLHSQEQPFVTALRREKTYRSSRGTVRESVTETERCPLTQVRREGKTLIFSGGDHRLTVEPEEIEKGIRLHFEGEEGWAYSFCLPAIAGEAVFGGGEQYRKTNLRGEQVVNFVSEHIKVGTILEKALLPRLFYKEKEHAAIGSYAPMPIFVTDTGRLIRFDTAADGYARFGAEEYRFVYDSCPHSLTLQQGSGYRELAALLARQIPNRQYLPDWCLDGMILGVQGGTQTVLDKTFAMLDAGAKICGVWSQDWSGCNRTVMGYQVWWNWEADRQLYPDLREAIEKLNARGVKFLAYINPYLVKGSRLYEYARERQYLITRTDGSVYHIKSTTFDAGMLDLTNPEAVRYIRSAFPAGWPISGNTCRSTASFTTGILMSFTISGPCSGRVSTGKLSMSTATPTGCSSCAPAMPAFRATRRSCGTATSTPTSQRTMGCPVSCRRAFPSAFRACRWCTAISAASSPL